MSLNTKIYPEFNPQELPSNFINTPIINSPSCLIAAKVPDYICDSLIAMFNTFNAKDFYDVGATGVADDQYSGAKGSKRVTNYDISFANYLTNLLSGHLPGVVTLNEFSNVDWQSDNPEKYTVWALEGVSPVFRYMEYTKGSEHFPHYDAPHKSKSDPLTRTLLSGVLYLTTNKSGATGFILDGQESIPFSERNLGDWDRQATRPEIESWQLPNKGSIITFPHQTCHTVFPLLEDDTRIIIRFDVFYTAIR